MPKAEEKVWMKSQQEQNQIKKAGGSALPVLGVKLKSVSEEEDCRL